MKISRINDEYIIAGTDTEIAAVALSIWGKNTSNAVMLLESGNVMPVLPVIAPIEQPLPPLPVLPEKDWITPRSSNVKRYGYDKNTGALYIEYKFGSGVYTYYDVPEKTYNDLRQSPSAGSFIASVIKGRYRFTRNDAD